jgi:hypothetical protein
MILAATSANGACSSCSAPYERIVTKPGLGDWNRDPSHKKLSPERSARRSGVASSADWSKRGGPLPETLGWQATCSHPLFPSAIEPCVVLDPFAGSGRTGLAALKLGRRFIGIELNARYRKMALWQFARVFDK